MYRPLSELKEVVTACADRPDIAPYARIVGQWVWVECPGKPSDDTRMFLKETGFRWNAERKAWQHACGHRSRRNRRIDPRQYYGQQRIMPEATRRPRQSDAGVLWGRIEKLENLTEARGATPGEAATAREKAARLRRTAAQQYA